MSEDNFNTNQQIMEDNNTHPNQQRVNNTFARQTKEYTAIVNKFEFFGLASILYGIFYCFCLYKNNSGITMPIFVAGSMVYLLLALKKLEIPVKKDSWFYMGAAILLGISNCMTDSWVLIFFNTAGIWLLILCLAIHQFYNDERWHFGKQASTIIVTLVCAIGHLGIPFRSLAIWRANRKNKKLESKKNSKAGYVWAGIFIAIPLLLIVCALLSSADAVFRNIFGNIFEFIKIPDGFVGITFKTIFGIFASYCILIELSKKRISEQVNDRKTWEPIIAITVTGLLTIVYLIFSTIQIVYLFGASMILPEEYTYAEYAREGFVQLLFVCIINLIIVVICVERFRENNVLKGILTVFSLCTYIMIASSAFRMLMYIENYYLTFLRVLVLFFLVLLALLLGGLLISIYKEAFPLFKYCVVVTAILYMTFSFAKPDYWIARFNIDMCMKEIETDQRTGSSLSNLDIHQQIRYGSDIDMYYLTENLSLDAAPALMEWEYFDDEYRKDYEHKISYKTDDMSIRGFNFSRNKAKQLVAKKH